MKTKPWKLLFLFLVIAPSAMYAQDEKSLWIDANAGFNSTWILNQNAYGNSEMEYASTFGLTGGLGVSYFLNDKWGVHTSAGFMQAGQNYTETKLLGSAKRNVKLSYVTVPLLLMRNIPNTNNPTWLAFGPELMFLATAKQKFEISEEYVTNNNLIVGETDIKDRIKPVDVAMKISVNKMYKLRSTDNLMLLLAFNTAIGVLDMNSKDWQIPNNQGDYKGSHNFYFGVTAGIMFNASKGK